MRIFGRKQPLHRRLADAAGLSLGETEPPAPGLAAAPPGWDGEQRGEPGIHGVPRARRWDAVATADAPGLLGDAVHFVALPDGSLVVDEDEPDGTLTPLADAVEARLEPPYRAEAIRRRGALWGVAGRRIAVAREPGLEGEEAELVVTGSGRTLTLDGRPQIARAPGLEAVGAAEGPEYVVRATRLDGDLWEVEASAL
ncbi:MAG: hypothetical protein ACXVQQ_02245 [Gaiellaceae bacterium]